MTEVLELPIVCFDFEILDKSIIESSDEYVISFARIKLFSQSLVDKNVDLEIHSIEMYNEEYIDMIKHFHKNNYFYRQDFYDKQKERMYDIKAQEGKKAAFKKAKKELN